MAETPKKPDDAVENLDDLKLKLNQEILETAQKQTEQAKMKAAAAEAYLSALKESNKYEKDSQEFLEAERKAITAKQEAAEAELRHLRLTGEAFSKRAEELDEELKKLKKQQEYNREQLKFYDEAEAREKRIKGLKQNTLDNMKQTVLSGLGLSAIMAKVGDQLASGKGLLGVWKAVYSEMALYAANMMIGIADGNSQFAAATGHVADRFVTFGMGMSKFGIGFEKLNKSAIDLYTTMSSFSELNNYVQQDLAESAALLNNLGVSMTTTGKNLDILTKSLRTSASQAKTINEDMAKAAIGAGIPPTKMLEGFASAMPKLAAYGKQGVDVYIQLQKQAKNLGMELQTLTGIIGDQFDTFEGSARAAGKLNAVLGGNFLNSVEMLNATESERVMILKRSFDQSGKNFDSLSKYEKKAVAATLGITDLNEASKLLGNSTTNLAMDMEKQAAQQEQLEKVAKEAAKITDKVKEAFNALIIVARPLIEIFSFLVNTIARMNDFLGGFGGLIWLTAGAVAYMSTSTSAFALRLKGLGTTLLGLPSRFTAWIASMRTTMATNNSLKLSTFSLKGAVDALRRSFSWAGAFGMLTTLMLLVSIFYELHDILFVPKSPILYFALIMLPFIIMAIGRAAETSSVGLETLGTSILMIGVGVGAAAAGLSLLVKSFHGLTGPEMAAALAAIVLVITGVIISIQILAPIAATTSIPIGALGLAFLMLGAGVALAALGLYGIVQTMKGLTDPKIFFGISALASGLLLLAPVLLTFSLMSPLLLIAGAAFLLLGAGLSLAGVGVMMISSSLPKIASKELASNLTGVADGLMRLAIPLLLLSYITGPLIALGAAFLIMGVGIRLVSPGIESLANNLPKITSDEVVKGLINLANGLSLLIPTLFVLSLISPLILVAGTGFLLMGTGIFLLSKAIDSIVSGLKSLSNILIPISQGINQLGLGSITLAIIELGNALQNIPYDKTIALKTLNETLTTVKTITPEDVKPTKDFIVAAEQYYKAQKESKDSDKDALVSALKEVFNSQNQNNEKEKKIQLIIRGDDLAKALRQGDTPVAAKMNIGI